jgi:hypothetical protein
MNRRIFESERYLGKSWSRFLDQCSEDNRIAWDNLWYDTTFGWNEECEQDELDSEPDFQNLHDYAKEPRKFKQVKVLCNFYFNVWKRIDGAFHKQHNFCCKEKKFVLPCGKSKQSLPNIHNKYGKRLPDGQSVYVRHSPRKYIKRNKAQREKKHMKRMQRDLKEACE